MINSINSSQPRQVILANKQKAGKKRQGIRFVKVEMSSLFVLL